MLVFAATPQTLIPIPVMNVINAECTMLFSLLGVVSPRVVLLVGGSSQQPAAFIERRAAVFISAVGDPHDACAGGLLPAGGPPRRTCDRTAVGGPFPVWGGRPGAGRLPRGRRCGRGSARWTAAGCGRGRTGRRGVCRPRRGPTRARWRRMHIGACPVAGRPRCACCR